MSITQLEIINRALIKCGANAISSLDENSVAAQIASRIYPSSRDSLLSQYPWRFAMQDIFLNATGNIAPNGDNEFYLPNDFLRAFQAFAYTGAKNPINYKIRGNKLYCNSSQCRLLGIFRPNEADFPPFFSHLLEVYLASEICLPLSEDAEKTKFFLNIFQNLLKNARTIDSQQESWTAITNFPLLEVR